MIRGKAWIVYALAAAALAGGVTTTAIVIPGMLIVSLTGGMAVEPPAVLLFVLVVAAVASVVFAVGLLVIGAPVWAAMHRRGLRSRKHAKTAGSLLTAGAVLAFSALSGPEGFVGGLIFATLMVLPGAVAGWVLHRVAYGAPEAPP